MVCGTWPTTVRSLFTTKLLVTACMSAATAATQMTASRITMEHYIGFHLITHITYHNGMRFTTKDRDNDLYSGNCATYEGGGFWYNNCASAHVANKIGVGHDFYWLNLPTGSTNKLSNSLMWLVCG